MQVPSYQVQHSPVTVVVTTRNTAASLMGGLAIFMGILALVFSWIPFLGMIAIPLGCIGGLLALIGFVVSACHGFRSWLLPVIGGFLCLCAVIASIVITGVVGAAVSDEMAKQQAIHEAQKKKIRADLEKSLQDFGNPSQSPKAGKSSNGIKF